jgi:uncharacterized protein (DUF1501 family)
MFSRRRFIRIGAASVGSLALRNFGVLPAMAQAASDYKALVCVFLFGGNDSNNTIIPVDLPQATYSEYQTIRKNLALSAATDLTTERLALDGHNYYFHKGLTELADLFTQGKMAVAANVGPLVQKVNRTQVSNPLLVPPHLFSHSDQQLEWQGSDATEKTPFGWGGLAADQAQSMNLSTFPTFLSVAGNDFFGTGQASSQIELTPGGSLGLTGFDYTLAQHRSAALNTLLTTETGLSLVGSANGVLSNSIADAKMLTNALKNVTVSTVFPTTSLGAQLKQVAQIIKARDTLQMRRQIFFCALGGFDTHTAELTAHRTLYPQLSQAVNAFYTAMSNELLVENNVTLFTESDFSRTFQPTTGDGSDHAWGSHHMVIGGAVKGNKIYGTFPTFALGSNDDFDTRGRWIPSSAVDQYGAALVNWFGVDATKVFKNVSSFGANPFTFFS